MRALTIRQPWADAITHSSKRCENRTWKTAYRGLVLIHAGAAHDRQAPAWGPRPDTRSAVIAAAQIVDCHYSDHGQCCPWGQENTYHWRLDGVLTLTEPVPATGRLGLWTPPDALVEAVSERLPEVTL